MTERWSGRCAFRVLPVLAMSVMLSGVPALAQPCAPPTAACCSHPDLAEQYGIIWTGHETKMPIERLAAYAAPVVWFSPDEPLLTIGQTGGRRARGKDILIPEPFPFENDPSSTTASAASSSGSTSRARAPMSRTRRIEASRSST
jgi:hypothetical protein